MAVIDLTLDSFKVPAIDGYTPPFGTMVTRTEANKGGLSTVEVNSNVIMPFANMRPKVISENSSTTEIEYDAKLCFSASLLAGATLELDDGAYEGCRVQITNLSSFACDVEYNSATLVSIPTGANVEVIWTGSTWMLSTTEIIASGNVMAPTSAAVQVAIRNQNVLSGLEQITSSGTALYDGIIQAKVTINNESGFADLIIYINGVQSSSSCMNFNQYGLPSFGCQAFIQKGDTWKISKVSEIGSLSQSARWYKLRDYTGR